jgi:hypothetical protein
MKYWALPMTQSMPPMMPSGRMASSQCSRAIGEAGKGRKRQAAAGVDGGGGISKGAREHGMVAA